MLVAILVAVSLAGLPAEAAGNLVQIDGKVLLVEQGFLVTEQGLLVPAGPVVKALGGTVSFDPASGKGTVIAGRRTITELVPGKSTALVNGYPVSMEGAVQWKEGELYLPASFLMLHYGDRLQINHAALREDRALQLLRGTLQPAPDGQDIRTEMKLVLEEPDYLWAAVNGVVEQQVRGSDSLTLETVNAPLTRLQTGSAVRNGHRYQMIAGQWSEDPYGAVPGSVDLFPMPLAGADFDPQMLLSMLIEARLGEQRQEGKATLQDVRLTLNLAPLLAGMGRPPGAAGEDEQGAGMPDLIMERAAAVLTVDTATGRIAATKLDLAGYIVMPADGEAASTVHAALHLTQAITPNSQPIAWPREINQ